MIIFGSLEMFYTTSNNDSDMYDQLYIDTSCKKYILEIEERDYSVVAYNLANNAEISPIYVARCVFDLIVNELNNKGFKRENLDLDF